MTLAEKLKWLRINQKKITQKQAAKVIGISLNTLGQYETDKIKPGADVLTWICDYYNCDANWL